VELGGGVLVRGQLADTRVENERARRDALWQVPCLDWKPHVFVLSRCGKPYPRNRRGHFIHSAKVHLVASGRAARRPG